MRIEFITAWVEDTLGKRQVAYTLEDLKTITIRKTETYWDEGAEKQREVSYALDSQENIKRMFPEAQFHWFEWREQTSGKDIEKAEAMQWRTLGNGVTSAAPWRYKKSWTLTLLTDWSYDKNGMFPLNEQGFDNLPDCVVYLMQDVVCAWKDATFPNFQMP